MNVRYLDSRVSDRQHAPLLRLPTIGAEAEPVQAMQPALLMTNEIVSPGQLVEWGNQHKPDGYIVAVGCGMSLLLPSLFSADRPPRGVLLVDLDDRVVAMAHAFVAALQQTQSYEEFHQRFLASPFDLAPGFVSSEHAEIIQRIEPYDRQLLLSGINRLRRIGSQEVNQFGQPNLFRALARVYPQWKHLADGGNIGIHQGSMLSAAPVQQQDFASRVRQLWSDYDQRSNVVYLSNILDHHMADEIGRLMESEPALSGTRSYQRVTSLLGSCQKETNSFDGMQKPAVVLHTLRLLRYRLQCSVASLNSVHPLDFEYAAYDPDLLQTFRSLLDFQIKAGVSVHSLAATTPILQWKGRESYYAQLHRYAAHLNMHPDVLQRYLSEVRSYVLSFVTTALSLGLSRIDAYQWIEQRFGPDVKMLVMRYQSH